MADPQKEAEILFKAIKDKDEKAIIALCLRTTNAIRLEILNIYKECYNQNLLANFRSIFNDNFLKTLIALFTEPIEYDANELKEAINTKNVDTLIEIIVSRPQNILMQIKDRYNKKYKSDIIKDVENKTSGYVKKILLSFLECKRSTNTQPNIEKCKKIASELFKAGEGKIGTDKSVFVKHFSTLSPNELKEVYIAYPKYAYKHNLMIAIDREFSSDLQKILRNITLSSINPSSFYACRVDDALKENSINNNILIRVLVSRSDIDMEEINKLFLKEIKKEIYDVVRGKGISWDYKTLILGIIDKKNVEKK